MSKTLPKRVSEADVVVGDVAVRYYVEDKAASYVLEDGMKYFVAEFPDKEQLIY